MSKYCWLCHARGPLREKVDQMLKQVQHDVTVWSWSFCHPELVSGSRFWVLEFRF